MAERLKNLGVSFARQPRWVINIFAVALLLHIGYGDWVTGPDLPFAEFYLIPVAMVTWLVGRRDGIVMACLAALVWGYAAWTGAQFYPHHALYFWNTAIRLICFVSLALVLSIWRNTGIQLTAIVEDRTAALQAEITKREQAAAALQKLAAQLSAAEDAERRRLAYDLHDSLSQLLLLVKLNLEALAPALTGPPHECERLAESTRIVDDLIKQTRTFMFDLHPAMLDDLGLVATLHWYAEQFRHRAGAEVAVSEIGDRQTLSTPLASYLFRAVKELLNNALRHGKAREIVLAVHWNPTHLRIVIDDDGCGFDVQRLSPPTGGGLGLPGIRERLTSLGGGMTLESQSGQGTRVILEVPLNPVLETATN